MEYWIERNRKAQQALTDKSIKQTNEKLKKYYGSVAKKVLGQFETTYNKLLLSMTEGKQPTPADLYKLDKYWQLQGQLRQELRELGERQVSLLTKQFEIQFFDVYYAIGIPGQEFFTELDNKIVQQMINQIWCADGKSWSQRIWDNTELLREVLDENLIESIITGKTTGQLKNLLMEKFDVSYNRADALVRTEMAHIQTQAAQKRYTDYGIQEMEVWVDEDERTCPICAKMEGKRVPSNGVMPLPAHPRCRCCMIPVID